MSLRLSLHLLVCKDTEQVLRDMTKGKTMNTTIQHDGYTITEAPAIKLGNSVFSVKIQDMEDGTEPMVWLTGSRGASYFLRGFLGDDSGKRQVISWNSGQPLRVKGNEVRVFHIGDVIEVA